MRLCAVSVDLDEIHHYYAIHGLAAPSGPGRSAVYHVALDRLDRWACALEIPLTLFAVGSDLGERTNAERLRAMAGRGHEIANHTLDHLYDLTRRDRAEVTRQIEAGALAIEAATGSRPLGFRAPGYTVTDAVYEVLRECGVTYDSSVFPCPAYYLAKVAKVSLIRLQGRASRSIVDSPLVLRAPTRPYRVGRPYWKTGSGLLEFPIQVTRGLRLPFFGTALTLAGPDRARFLSQGVVGEPFVNIELHGMDVLDVGDGFAELGAHQPDAWMPYRRKIEALTAVVEHLKAARYSFIRLDEAAHVFA